LSLVLGGVNKGAILAKGGAKSARIAFPLSIRLDYHHKYGTADPDLLIIFINAQIQVKILDAILNYLDGFTRFEI
jgi:hypothetical protein